MKKTCFILCFFAYSFSLCSQDITVKENSLFSTEVYFDFAQDTLRTEADSALNEVLKYCAGKSGFRIKVTAHTDHIGANKNNMELSQRRGASVINYLEENGLEADSLTISVFGEEQPVASNETDEGRQKNRRATVEVIKIKKMTTLTGEILDKETGEGIEADVVIRSKETRDSTKTDKNGQFEALVPLNEVIGVDVWAKGYFLESQMMKVAPDQKPEMKVELPPVREGEKVDIKNLYFVGNEAILLKKSEPELPKILKFMQINKGIKIEIAGHINRPNEPPVHISSWDFGLSRRRALLVYNYLIENGISEDRLTHKGYGNWEMRYPNAKKEYLMAQNRRVEIRVLEMKENQ